MKKAWSFLLVENMCTAESKHNLSVSYDYDQSKLENIDEWKQPWETLSSLLDLKSWKKSASAISQQWKLVLYSIIIVLIVLQLTPTWKMSDFIKNVS